MKRKYKNVSEKRERQIKEAKKRIGKRQKQWKKETRKERICVILKSLLAALIIMAIFYTIYVVIIKPCFAFLLDNVLIPWIYFVGGTYEILTKTTVETVSGDWVRKYAYCAIVVIATIITFFVIGVIVDTIKEKKWDKQITKECAKHIMMEEQINDLEDKINDLEGKLCDVELERDALKWEVCQKQN